MSTNRIFRGFANRSAKLRTAFLRWVTQGDNEVWLTPDQVPTFVKWIQEPAEELDSRSRKLIDAGFRRSTERPFGSAKTSPDFFQLWEGKMDRTDGPLQGRKSVP